MQLPVLFLACLLSSVNALYFYLEGAEQKCFIEELPRETTVVGSYRSEDWTDAAQAFQENPLVGIQIAVEVLPSRHKIIDQKGSSYGRFTFTTAEAGDHLICLYVWRERGRVREEGEGMPKLHLDLMFGDATHDTAATKKEIIGDLTYRVKEVNNRIRNIRTEQQHQRDREMEFRDTSERTNSHVVNWTIVQFVVLG
ncbi:emp24/gp25L/p24 family/GOLD-domain-containing protein, partial [Blyttiomyces helicus]